MGNFKIQTYQNILDKCELSVWAILYLGLKFVIPAPDPVTPTLPLILLEVLKIDYFLAWVLKYPFLFLAAFLLKFYQLDLFSRLSLSMRFYLYLNFSYLTFFLFLSLTSSESLGLVLYLSGITKTLASPSAYFLLWPVKSSFLLFLKKHNGTISWVLYLWNLIWYPSSVIFSISQGW